MKQNYTVDTIQEVMTKERVHFESIIRIVNFWNGLTIDEKDQAIKWYDEGKLKIKW